MSKRQKRERVFQIWDDEVEEFFNEYGDGKIVAAYFECLRYRQQLTPDEWFTLSSVRIEELTGIRMWKQQNSRRILQGAGWIETQFSGHGYDFFVTNVAREAIKHIPHKRSNAEMLKLWGSYPQKHR